MGDVQNEFPFVSLKYIISYLKGTLFFVAFMIQLSQQRRKRIMDTELNKYEYHVYLARTCNNSKWREELIKKL